MPYRPPDAKTYRTRVRFLGMRRDVSLKTQWLPQAQRREQMLAALDAHDVGRDILRALNARTIDVEQIAEAYRSGDKGLTALLRDTAASARGDMASLKNEWLLTVSPGTRAQHKRQVNRWLGDYPNLSDLTAANVTPWLEALPGKANTKWHYGVSLKSFASWLHKRGLLPEPEFTVPSKPASHIRWHDLDAILRLIAATPEPYRAAFALAYGAGLERGVLLSLRKRDLIPEQRMVRAAGTKTGHRDRMARIEAWAWPHVQAHVQLLTPDARLYEGVTGKMLLTQHARAQAACHLPLYTLHDARHSWAVRMIKAGVPLEAVSRQLGHRDAVMVLRVYGRFQVDHTDWDRWEQKARMG